MAVQIKNSYGVIEITNDVIADVVGGAATEVFGIVGMASRHQVRDGISEILNQENYSRGVIVRQENERIVIDVYIITQYGLKISEVSKNVQERVAYQLKSTFDIEPDAVNVFVQSVRVPSED